MAASPARAQRARASTCRPSHALRRRVVRNAGCSKGRSALLTGGTSPIAPTPVRSGMRLAGRLANMVSNQAGMAAGPGSMGTQ